jgi:hypothetical protein
MGVSRTRIVARVFEKGRRSRNWSTTIDHRGYRSSGSLGSQAYGGRTVQPVMKRSSTLPTQALNLFFHNEQTQTNKSREKNECESSGKFNDHGQFPQSGSNQETKT